MQVMERMTCAILFRDSVERRVAEQKVVRVPSGFGYGEHFDHGEQTRLSSSGLATTLDPVGRCDD